MKLIRHDWPSIIQGGMSVAISNWSLARAVSVAGQLGVVSGTGIDTVLLRRLQDGDIGGHMRRALAHSPWPALVEEVLTRYFRPHGRTKDQPYMRLPHWTLESNRWQSAMAMLGGFAEVWLAKSSHNGKIGMNLLSKVALPNLSVLYGAMHANVDAVLMGAGIPREIPGALDQLARHETARLHCEVVGLSTAESPWIYFDPKLFDCTSHAPLMRPAFFPIISSYTLAQLMAKKATGSVEGFIIEGPTAGGHNAPPRGAKKYDALGQPIYNERDVVDLEVMTTLGYPFWLAGGLGSAGALKGALDRGAHGIQVGTLFAYCNESGMADSIKQEVISTVCVEPVTVFTDPLASPTGFPFKVVDLEGTLAKATIYEARSRICDLGYLREAYVDDQGAILFRCASEPVDAFVKKGGKVEDTVGRKCLCNGLLATAGLAQHQAHGVLEPMIVTSGDELAEIRHLIIHGQRGYSAQDVIDYLMKEYDGTMESMPL